MERRQRRNYSENFKLEMVQLFLNGAPRKQICEKYQLTASSLDRWITDYGDPLSTFKTIANIKLENIEKKKEKLNNEVDLTNQKLAEIEIEREKLDAEASILKSLMR